VAGAGPGERAFVNSLSGGVSARANVLAHRIRRRLPVRGRLCYVLGGIAALVTVPARRCRVTGWGKMLYDGRALNLTVANGATFGGGIPISPGSSPADGVLELVIIGDLGLPRAAVALARLLAGTHLSLRGIARQPVTAVRIDRDGEIEIEADGHRYVAAGGVDVTVRPGALRLLG
jgi:diacylglycerol kinase (ATP)